MNTSPSRSASLPICQVMSTEHDSSPGSAQYNFLQQDLMAANANRAQQPWLVFYGHKVTMHASIWFISIRHPYIHPHKDGIPQDLWCFLISFLQHSPWSCFFVCCPPFCLCCCFVCITCVDPHLFVDSSLTHALRISSSACSPCTAPTRWNLVFIFSVVSSHRLLILSSDYIVLFHCDGFDECWPFYFLLVCLHSTLSVCRQPMITPWGMWRVFCTTTR